MIPKTQIILNADAFSENFVCCKEDLINFTMLAHPAINATLTISMDAPDFATGNVLHQIVENKISTISRIIFKETRQNPKKTKYMIENLLQLTMD